MDDIKKHKVMSAVKKLKRRKAPGPDEVPIEIFKEMEDHSIAIIVQILNDWWNKGSIPEEVLQARVVLIFKKGDTSK